MCCLSGLFVSDEGVEDGEEFVPGGDEGEFLVLSAEEKLPVEVVDDGVETDGAEGGQVECGANGGSPAEAGLFATKGSAVAVDRRDPDEQGDLLSRELSEFRELGNEGSGGLRSDAFRGPEELVGLVPDGAVFEALVARIAGDSWWGTRRDRGVAGRPQCRRQSVRSPRTARERRERTLWSGYRWLSRQKVAEVARLQFGTLASSATPDLEPL